MELEALKFIGVGLCAFGLIGAGIGVGAIFSSYFSSVARNPGVESKIKGMAFVGAAFAEVLGLLAFVLGILIFSSKPSEVQHTEKAATEQTAPANAVKKN
jgi:F-type H+-transporting ATPase subunit c